uniref:Uncharacterized protein n=1 Tax=Cucumis melo TaxID=3656 RepID=A0A9I9E2D6_CUCME
MYSRDEIYREGRSESSRVGVCCMGRHGMGCRGMGRRDVGRSEQIATWVVRNRSRCGSCGMNRLEQIAASSSVGRRGMGHPALGLRDVDVGRRRGSSRVEWVFARRGVGLRGVDSVFAACRRGSSQQSSAS